MDASLRQGREEPGGSSRSGHVPSVAASDHEKYLVPALVLLLGLALRIYRINQESVGHDEAFSLTVSQMPLGEMVRTLVADFVHPPLHYFALRGWCTLFGFGVFQARLLSALLSSLAVVVLYVFAENLFDRRTALLASLLLATSQITIMLAQEPRPYAQFLLLLLVSAHLFVRALRDGRALYWWGFVGGGVLMIWTHYFGFLAIASLAFYAWIYRKRYRLPVRWVLAGAAVALVLYLPWMASGVIPRVLHARKTFSGVAPGWAVHWSTLFTAVNSFNNGKPNGLLDSSPWWTFATGGALFCVPALLTVWKVVATRDEREREGVALAGILWVLPIVLAMGLGALHLQYNVRYVAFCAAPYYILVARGISELRVNAVRWGLGALILAYSANALRANYFLQWKENFRDAFVYVESSRQEGDCGIFLPGLDVPAQWTITQGDRPFPFRVIPKDGLAAGASACPRIWAVSWALAGNPSQQAQTEIERRPLELTHVKIADRRYFGVRVDLYSRREEGVTGSG